MAVTGVSAIIDVPETYNIQIGQASASGTINFGDWLVYSGNAVLATNAGGVAYWKASAAGVALESNPTFDMMGRSVSNTALRYARGVVLRVTAAFSGRPALGVGVYPVSTGSGVNSPTGLTGVGATWQTGVKLLMSGATGAGGSGVGYVVAWYNRGNGGTGEMDIVVPVPRPDYY